MRQGKGEGGWLKETRGRRVVDAVDNESHVSRGREREEKAERWQRAWMDG